MKERPSRIPYFMEKILRPLLKVFYLVWSRPILKDTFITTFFTIVGRSVGFVIPFFIAAWYGVGSETDAFFFVYGFIFFFTTLFSNILGSIIVPFIAELKSNKSDLGGFVSALLARSSLLVLVIILVACLLGYRIIAFITGFSDSQIKLVYVLFLETIPLVLLGVLSSLIGGTLNAHQKFAGPQFSLGFRSSLTLAFLFSFKNILGIHAIPLGYVIGEAVRSFYLFLELKKILNISFKLKSSLREVNEFFRKAIIQMTGFFALYLNSVVNRTIASWFVIGSVSVLEYAFKLYILPIVLVGEGLFIVLLSHWSKRSYEGEILSLRNNAFKTARFVLLIAVSLTIAIFFWKYHLCSLAFGWGNFPKNRLHELSEIFGFYILGMPLFLLNGIFCRGLLVLKETSCIAIVGITMAFANLVFNLFLTPVLGLKGIALSSSLVEVVGGIGFFFFFNKKTLLLISFNK